MNILDKDGNEIPTPANKKARPNRPIRFDESHDAKVVSFESQSVKTWRDTEHPTGHMPNTGDRTR